MVGGALLHAGFSLRALWQVGCVLPTLAADGVLRDPAEDDPRLAHALATHEDADFLGARVLYQEVLEAYPGSLVAHAELGVLHALLRQAETAHAHFTAAVRLGSAALAGADPLEVDGSRLPMEALVSALVGRARLLADAGRARAAARDLRRAIAWSPDGSARARALLAELEATHGAGDG